LSERPTAVPLVGAALEILTVHVLLALDPILVGLQDTEETVITGGAVRPTVVVAVPLRVAVMIALWVPVTATAVAVKVALVAPCDTAIVAGTLRFELLDDRATVTPLPAAALTVT